MKKFIVKSHKDEQAIRYPDDCQKIKEALACCNLDASLEQCQDLWERYSDTYAAGWLCGIESMTFDQIYECVEQFIWLID